MKTFSDKLKRWTMLLLPLLIVGLVLVACDGDDDNDNAGAGGGLGTTPDVAETDVVPVDTPVIEMTDTPEIIEEDTPVVENTATPEMEETPVIEPTADTAEPTTEAATPDDTVGEPGMTSGVILASDLIGTDVEDQTGEEIGTVTEALANTNGEIMYVIVDVDALELGDDDLDTDGDDTVTDTVDTTDDAVADSNMIALSWDDFTIEVDLDEDELLEEDRDFNVILNGDLATMEMTRISDDFLSFLDEDDYIVDDEFDADLDISTEYSGLVEVSSYDNFDLQTTAEDDLGDTEDLLIDIANGRIMYAVLDVGGFLGIGENEVAVPWSAVVLDETTLADDGEIFRIDVDQTFLEDAPTIDLDEWASDVEQGWDQVYRDYWVDFIEEF